MKKVFNYLPLQFVVSVILGIVLQFYTQFWEFGFLNSLFVFFTILLLLLVVKNNITTTILSFLLFFTIGVSIVFVNNDKNYNNYYNNYIDGSTGVVLRVAKVLKPTTYHYKYQVKVVQVGSVKTTGKVLLNVSKDRITNPLKVDELIFANPIFVAIPKPVNPHQFNYQLYMKKQGIYQQIYLNDNDFKSLGIQQFSLQGSSAKFRRKVQKALRKYPFTSDEFAVINALLLGQRQEISKELSANYAKAGAIHILAVSGLHVGILLWILTWLLKPLEILPKGKIIKIVCIVFILWMFAFIAGLSASVTRAVTMFTFLAIGLTFQRKNVVLFSLISSMFLLLICKPMFLFDVGFQLSYLAVFGIIFLQPKLFRLYNPKFWLDKKIWEIISVSVAAQIGVLPLSLFYFHQFPGLFMVSNLVIIPFLSAILLGGIFVIIFALLGWLPEFLASIYGDVIAALNAFVNWVSNHEEFLFQEISFSLYMALAAYIIIFNFYRFLIDKSTKKMMYFLFSIVIIQSVCLFENYQKETKKEFLVFHKSRNTIMGKRIGGKLFIDHDLDSIDVLKFNAIASYTVGEYINTTIKKREISNVYRFKNQVILVVDSLGVYQIKNLKNPIVLLQQSPKINLERLIKTLKPKHIIADGSNYKSYVKRWQKTAKNQKTPLHYTGTNGVFKY
ncbi:ComEC/Rec2 family competence protein [Polaribacter sp. R77954]|uniref:ComEC/Rec2 family competence protein n=1 Tax=Polaribacter sp. R77954 TaxID=3093870 RepID=UPI0037C92BA7